MCCSNVYIYYYFIHSSVSSSCWYLSSKVRLAWIPVRIDKQCVKPPPYVYYSLDNGHLLYNFYKSVKWAYNLRKVSPRLAKRRIWNFQGTWLLKIYKSFRGRFHEIFRKEIYGLEIAYFTPICWKTQGWVQWSKRPRFYA